MSLYRIVNLWLPESGLDAGIIYPCHLSLTNLYSVLIISFDFRLNQA
jgi:hypothetical protein